MKKVVSNATPIISLASVGKLSVLEKIFKKIYLPGAVHNEIQSGQYPGYKDLNRDFFEVIDVKDKVNLDFLLNDLDQGEAESIILAKEMKADTLIIDERLAYKIAQSQGLPVIGTLTVLLMAKNRGIIQEIKPILDEMIEKGRWYSRKVYEYFLLSIEEI